MTKSFVWAKKNHFSELDFPAHCFLRGDQKNSPELWPFVFSPFNFFSLSIMDLAKYDKEIELLQDQRHENAISLFSKQYEVKTALKDLAKQLETQEILQAGFDLAKVAPDHAMDANSIKAALIKAQVRTSALKRRTVGLDLELLEVEEEEANIKKQLDTAIEIRDSATKVHRGDFGFPEDARALFPNPMPIKKGAGYVYSLSECMDLDFPPYIVDITENRPLSRGLRNEALTAMRSNVEIFGFLFSWPPPVGNVTKEKLRQQTQILRAIADVMPAEAEELRALAEFLEEEDPKEKPPKGHVKIHFGTGEYEDYDRYTVVPIEFLSHRATVAKRYFNMLCTAVPRLLAGKPRGRKRSALASGGTAKKGTY